MCIEMFLTKSPDSYLKGRPSGTFYVTFFVTLCTLRHSKNATSSSMKSERLFLPGFCCSAETRTVSHVTGYAVYYFFLCGF